MVERGGGDLLERLGPDLSAAVLRCLDDPADLVRSASVSQSWRRFVVTNGFCQKLCLRTTPEISCLVRVIEVGGLSDTVEVGPNCSGQWKTLESEHRIYAYFGYRIVSPRFLIESPVEPIAASATTDRIENMLLNNITPNRFLSYWSCEGKSSRTFRLSYEFCVVHEIKIQKIQLPQVFHFCEPPICLPPETLRFRLGHMRDENATPEESLVGNFIWTYVSPEFSMIVTDDFQSLKLQRPVVCIGGVLQIELLSWVQNNATNELFHISAYEVKVIVYPLSPTFDVSLPDRMGNSILMYFPGTKDHLEDVAVRRHSCSSRRKSWMKTKRRKKNH